MYTLMKVTYDLKGDTLRILFRSAPISETESHRSGLILDYDQQGRIVGLELTDASAHMSRPQAMDFIEHVTAPAGEEMANT